MGTVYKVYDEDWSGIIVGPKDLRDLTKDYAADMLFMNTDREIKEYIRRYVKEEHREAVREMTTNLRNNLSRLNNADTEVLIGILNMMGFTVEEIKVR